MEQAYCTAVFWRGGEKIDLNGLKPVTAVEFSSNSCQTKVQQLSNANSTIVRQIESCIKELSP